MSICLLPFLPQAFKALANEGTLLRTHCCSWCFFGAQTRATENEFCVFPCCANWETFVAHTKCFWTESETSFLSRIQNLCPQQILRAQANGETFVPATMCLRWPGPLGLACAIHQCASLTIFTKNEARKTETHESMKNGNGFVSK